MVSRGAAILAFVFVVLGGCREPTLEAARPAPDPARRGDPPTPPLGDEVRYLVPVARGPEFYARPRDASVAYFELDERDVRAFEERLPAFLRSADHRDAPEIAARLSQYRRQFVGVRDAEGERIFGNFFCTEDPATRPLLVDDGGSCYFSVFYDPATVSFSYLFVHGEA
jgi:hypothetical protein